MLDFYADTLVNSNLLELLSERGRNRVVKESLRHGLMYWHERILPKHFILSSQARYGLAFQRSPKKAKTGQPALVSTGEFRDRILSNPTIRATFRNASIRYQFGRPSTSFKRGDLSAYRDSFTADLRKTNPRDMESKSRNRIFGFMKGKKIKFEEARKQILASTQKKVFSATSYSSKTKKQMVTGVQVMNADDRKEVTDVMQSFVEANWQTLGKANVKVNK